MNTTVKIGGRVIPMQRAIAMGLVDKDGNAQTPAPDSQAAALIRKEERKAQWTAKQATPPRRRGRKVQTGGTGAKVEGPETTSDGKIRRKREPKPLVPQNVTPDGEPITDEEVLAEIAAKTAAIEAAKATEAAEAATGDEPEATTEAAEAKADD